MNKGILQLQYVKLHQEKEDFLKLLEIITKKQRF